MNYTTSRDYDLLIRLMQSGHRLACWVNYRFHGDKPDKPPCRDICATRYQPPMEGKNPEEHYFAAQARGIGYAGGLHMTAAEFKKDCQAVDLEFILPANQKLEWSGPPVDFREWWDSKDHTYGGDATPLAIAGLAWEAAHKKYKGDSKTIVPPPATQFKTAFISQFLASYVAVHFDNRCSRGLQETLERPPVEDAEYLAEKVWEHYCKTISTPPDPAASSADPVE